MPNDVLTEDVNDTLRTANEFLASGRQDPQSKASLAQDLEIIQSRLDSEIRERQADYIAKLNVDKNSLLGQLHEKEKAKRVEDAVHNQSACDQAFNEYRQVNGGAYPRNISPVVYSIPLIFMGIAEWYVNYATFAAHFVPFFAAAATVLVAFVFAGASHLHGAYLKQLSEILHPSLEYRHKIDRFLILIIVTVLLIGAFGVVVWLRYLLVAEQLGIGTSSSGTFGEANTGMVWSRVGPTIFINLLIWGLGTVYAWWAHEKVPELRESYRALRSANRRLEKVRKPIVAEENRIKAKFDVEIKKNQVAIKEYSTSRDAVRDMLKRLGSDVQGNTSLRQVN